MTEPSFDVSREAALALTDAEFRRVRNANEVVVLPPLVPEADGTLPTDPEQNEDGRRYQSLFQAAMIAVRAKVTIHPPPGPISRPGKYVGEFYRPRFGTFVAVAVLRDPAVYGAPSNQGRRPIPERVRPPRELADEYAIHRAREPLLAALRERGVLPTPVEWYVWACEECGRQGQKPPPGRETFAEYRCGNHGKHHWPFLSRYQVVPAPGETEVPENVLRATPENHPNCRLSFEPLSASPAKPWPD